VGHVVGLLVGVVTQEESGLGPPSQLYALMRWLLQKERCTSGSTF
jgi:hypothetical protein